MKFSPCTGQCTDQGSHCEGCGRSHEEIAETKNIVKTIVAFSQKMQYENPEDFTAAISKNVLWKLNEAN
jgi:hypothetical protein